MVCSVTRIVSRETFSFFAAAWIFAAVSGGTPSPSPMAEMSFSGTGEREGCGTGVGDTFAGPSVDDGVPVGSAGSGDDGVPVGSAGSGDDGVSVGSAGSGDDGISVGSSGSEVGVITGGVGVAGAANVTSIVWLFCISGMRYTFPSPAIPPHPR